jgi:hypothetical protein
MSDIHSEALRRRIAAEFADRRGEVERVELFTHEGRSYVLTGAVGRPRDITPMVRS